VTWPNSVAKSLPAAPRKKIPKRSPQNKKVKYKGKEGERAIGKAGVIKSRRIY
jgi:hypothetical protein